MASAGIVVLIIILYYLTSYDPGLDPFRKSGVSNSVSAVPFRENSFDVELLSLPKTIKLKLEKLGLRKLLNLSNEQINPPSSRREAAYIQVEKAFLTHFSFLANSLRSAYFL
jgi:hypothetical protein